MENNTPNPEMSIPELVGGGGVAERVAARGLEARRVAAEREVQALVDAAFGLIEEKGELEPRVSEIVERAGLSNQAFYRHFRSKRELLVAVLDEGTRILADHLTRRMAEAAPGAPRVRAWLDGMLEQALRPDRVTASRPFALARGRLAEAHADAVASSEARISALARDALAEARRAGDLAGCAPEGDAETLYHLAMGWIQARLVDGGPGARGARADAERLVAFAMSGLARTGDA